MKYCYEQYEMEEKHDLYGWLWMLAWNWYAW